MVGVFAAALLFIDLALPPISVVQFLPPKDYLWDILRVNRQARCDVEFFMEHISHTENAVKVLNDLQARYGLYDDMRDAHATYISVLKRRIILWRIVRDVGAENMLKGEYPWILPDW